MIFLGLDPGLSGAVAAIFPDGTIKFHDMPVLQVKKKMTLDYCGLAFILKQYAIDGEVMAAIELVGAMPGNGVSSMFNFGKSYGAVLGTLATLQISYRSVTPQSWKKYHRLIGCQKDESRSRALEIFPNAAEHLRLKKHHNRSDALLMAEYLRRSLSRFSVKEG